MASRDAKPGNDSDAEYEEVGGDVGVPPPAAPGATGAAAKPPQQQPRASGASGAAPSGIPGLPARPAGGLGALPPRGLTGGLPARTTPGPAPASAAPTAAASSMLPAGSSIAAAGAAAAASSITGPSLPIRPAGGLGALPPRGMGAGLAPKPAQPATNAAASTPAAPPPAQQQQTAAPTSTPAASSTLPSLPARPAAPPASLGAATARPAGLRGAPELNTAGRAPPSAAPAATGVRAAAPMPPSALSPAPQLVARPTPQPSESVVDPTEERKGARIQAKVQEARVRLVRAAGRLGLRYDSEQVQQFMGVINRVEQVAGAGLYKGAGRRVDLAREAERMARQLDSQEPPDSKLGIKVKVLLLGISGTGKSELINALLERPASRTSAFRESTKRVRVVRGTVHGIQMELIDTPGLHASATHSAENRFILKAIRAAYKWHKPNYVFWVDRLDSGRSALGELSLLGQVNEVLGSTVWRETMVLLTHAHACRAAMGAAYETFGRQRRNIISQLLRQAAGNQQVRNPMFLVDSHPSCPTNSFGQPIIFEGANTVAWKQALMLQLVGYRLYESVQALFRDGSKAKAAAAAGKQADLFKQMMRPRLPPVSFYVEQLCEGVLAPDGWAAMEDPQDAGTEDLEAEEFEHAYYRTMYDLSCKGDPWAQKEYAMMLAKQERIRSTYKDAFKNEDIEQLAAAGYEGYVAEGLDLGPTFDPMQGTNHRYVYAVPEADWQIMPTLDYYGFEHEDAISGFVAEWEGQPFNRHGWGGMPLNVHLAVEKDKTSTCLQGEVHASVVHTVPPWGSRHITQLAGAFEVLRPNIKDVLYQLEVNTFKDGFLADNDHAAVGLMVSRLGESGKVTKGPMGLGLRLQDTLRVGAFKVEGCAAKVTAETAQGGRDEAWGARAFVHYDYLPGVGMLFDFYQQRTKDTDQFNVMGTAANFTYDFAIAGCACGLEVDWVPGHEQMHVDLNVFSGSSYKPAWLLLVPAVNYLKGLWRSWRQGAGGDGAGEGDYGEEGEEDDKTGSLTPEQQAQVQLQQMMRMMGMGGR